MPAVAVVALAATWGSKPPTVVLVVVAALLAGAVLVAVHHAEVVAHRVGEPYGSLILAVAVTVIEVGLILTLIASGGAETGHARPGHRLRRRHDHLQRDRGAVVARRGRAPPVVEFNAEGTAARSQR